MRTSTALSPREKQVLAMVWDDLQMKEISEALGLSFNYVKNMHFIIYRKLGAKGKVGACRRGIELGYLEVKSEAATI